MNWIILRSFQNTFGKWFKLRVKCSGKHWCESFFTKSRSAFVKPHLPHLQSHLLWLLNRGRTLRGSLFSFLIRARRLNWPWLEERWVNTRQKNLPRRAVAQELTALTRKSVCFESGPAAAKSLQSCPTLCDPIDGSPRDSPVPGILQARTLEWVAISFSNRWKWKMKVKLLSRVRLFVTPWTSAYQAPPSMGFSRQEYWSGVPLPSPSASSRTS